MRLLAVQGLTNLNTKDSHALRDVAGVTMTMMKEMLYMKCGVLKSNEDMILALAGQFKQKIVQQVRGSYHHMTMISVNISKDKIIPRI